MFLLSVGSLLLTLANALGSSGNGPDEDGKYTLTSEGIRAQFIPYGASLTNLFVSDVHGIERDIVLGFDNASYYSQTPFHPHLNGIPGRYANRIRNGTFTIDSETYHTDLNERGLDTLHGGRDGWDYRNWTVAVYGGDSITFSLDDADGREGFPGRVISNVTYTLTPYTWKISMTAISLTKKSPIMLTSHTYWNLDGFQNPDTPLALNYTLHVPNAGLRTEVDGTLIPTGNLLANVKGGVHDWWSAPKRIGTAFDEGDALRGQCGTNCTDYDTCYILNRRDGKKTASSSHYMKRESDDEQPPQSPAPSLNNSRTPVATLASPFSGISIDIFTDQAAFQLYTCNNMNGSFALKKTQGFFNDTVAHPRVTKKYGCVVIEVQDWIDGINHPEWGRKQIYAPGETFRFDAEYKFSTVDVCKGNGTTTGTCS